MSPTPVRALAIVAAGGACLMCGCSLIDLNELDTGSQKSAVTSPDASADGSSVNGDGDDASDSTTSEAGPEIEAGSLPDARSLVDARADAPSDEASTDAGSDARPLSDASKSDASGDAADEEAHVSEAGSDAAEDSGPVLVALSRTGWMASADVDGMTTWASTNSPSEAIDSDPGDQTRWTSAQVQTAGQWFAVDMTKTQTFSEIVMDSGPDSQQDYPRFFEVDISNDGSTWTQAATGTGTSESVSLAFAPKVARYVRIQISQDSGTIFWWSIADFEVYDAP